MFSYGHQAFLTETFLVRGLKAVGLDHADVLVLGYRYPMLPTSLAPMSRSGRWACW